MLVTLLGIVKEVRPVPAQNSSNVYGLYDTIGQMFYTSAGTAFSGG